MSKQTEYTVINAGHAVARHPLRDEAHADARRNEPVPEAIRTIALDADALDDEWFGSFDDSQPVDFEEDVPTTRWHRISTWMRNLKRAA